MNKDILRLAGVINENEGYFNRLPKIAGTYEALTIIVRNKLESYLEQLDKPGWTREENSKTMLDLLEKGVREALAEMERTERKIKELVS
jgi:hypothetical protein